MYSAQYLYEFRPPNCEKFNVGTFGEVRQIILLLNAITIYHNEHLDASEQEKDQCDSKIVTHRDNVERENN